MMLKIVIVSCCIALALCQPVGKCPRVDGRYPVYLSDSRSCTKFYECSNGRPYQLKCAYGTYFDSHSRICKHKQDVTCGSRRRD
ncbi:unnamed protein product [Diabrotica balteata]|uniref:Chitin-binding type-2 domain-containing protein n=1 Tax=Diabrotica balteata TaxID=107213 RepID=A0A9N9SU18_DIABA|nr:unnamed protein product [Diabrotica balteata]